MTQAAMLPFPQKREVCSLPEPADESFDYAAWLPRQLPATEDESTLFVRRLMPLVTKLIRSRRPRPGLEEDLVQMVFMRIFRKFHQYSGAVPLTHWVSRVTINTCIRVLQQETRREHTFSELDETHVPEPDFLPRQSNPGETLERDEEALLLLDTLSELDRRIMELLYMHEHSLKEVSTRTGLSVEAVKMRAHRARAKLRKTFESIHKMAA